MRLDHPERCDAARCTVPSFSDVVISVPINAYSGKRFTQRVCLGHYYAIRALIAQLVLRGVQASIQTAAEAAAAARPQQQFVNMTFTSGSGGFSTTGSTYSSGRTPWGF